MQHVGEGPGHRDAEERKAETDIVQQRDADHVAQPDAAAVEVRTRRVHVAVRNAHVHPPSSADTCAARSKVEFTPQTHKLASYTVTELPVNSTPEVDFVANSNSNSGIVIVIELASPSPSGFGIESESPSFELELNWNCHRLKRDWSRNCVRWNWIRNCLPQK